MGTRGYRVYRHKGYYHVHYNHYDSYPSGLGVKVASEVPLGDEEVYQKWLKKLREALDHHFEQNRELIGTESGAYYISTEAPSNDLWIEWMYEIDLDHEVFLVDSRPLFALNNMPATEDSFIEYIGFDSYGNRSYKSSTPIKHIYNWKSTPPKVDDQVIHRYNARQTPNSGHAAIPKLFGSSGPVGDCETVRIALYEALVAAMMQNHGFVGGIFALETASDRTQISTALLCRGVELIQLAFGRTLLCKTYERPPPTQSEFSWLATNVCLRITTHLDDERHLKKSVLELVDEIEAKPRSAATFGVLFSFFHCVVVCTDLQGGFHSTAALQFLPSFHATSPSTPGITAIARLAYHCLDIGSVTTETKIPSDHFLHDVPLEVLELIVRLLGPSDLQNLCTVIPLFEPAAEYLLRYPHIEDYRLIEHLPFRNDEDSDIRTLTSVLKKRFSAVRAGSSPCVLAVGIGGTRLSVDISSGGDEAAALWWGIEEVNSKGSEKSDSEIDAALS
ncbi:hypothetical protein C8F04DRAFT_1104747 [Mycena alexandri]|uniref:F-box domain-containing protein n=1 Tax=Mycena alexandri TaxID=1745969 RepID=A0AAD6X1S3_9AGAR|nr:hypothetical protein C8F04DRAFT_1104747 [Mycena alexandri]